MVSKYKSTIIGFYFAIPSFIMIIDELEIISIIVIITLFPVAVPLELLGDRFFDSHDLISLIVVLVLLSLFVLTTYYYLKKLLKEGSEGKPFKVLGLWIYFILLLFIIHPLVFYIWSMIHSESAGDGQFIFGVIDTFPISSFLFVVLGATVDYFRRVNTFDEKIND
ncbi:hypothetical protein [Aureibacter tunicatorum]|uniref:Uncharacterized protein n=1 Tax=Aureibacter tunicatorum TaxID=866807 RepID=A0AAE3XSW4_9BACT|nr:hypothetical protein [Aureibacter tunicatorum]MDR6241493.1 hypothetical protein [Aureibacter tunicatorum]BDD06664.1 hypothetical protein AUTU_41470 [Aureibacter tunicatorum]